MGADTVRVQALLRHLADYGRFAVWVVLIAVVLLCIAFVAAFNRVAALLGRRPQPTRTGEHSAA